MKRSAVVAAPASLMMMAMMMMMMIMMMMVWMMPATTLAFSRGVLHFRQDTDIHHPQQILHHLPHPERGYVENCGPGGGFFNISWYPKKLSPTRRVKFFANFTTPVDMEEVHVVGALFYEGRQMVAIDSTYSCEYAAQQVARAFSWQVPHVKCPIRKGERFSGSFLFTDTTQVIGFDGDYELKASIKDLHGNDLICIDVKITVLPFP